MKKIFRKKEKTFTQLDRKYLTGFTLIELITVVIIIGVIAAFAIPSYQTAIERTHRRDAETNLMAIHADNKIYFSDKSVYWPDPVVNDPPGVLLAGINSALKLSIIANGMDYKCSNTAANNFTCTAVRQSPAPVFTLTITQAFPSTAISCTGTCP